ncbi:MAG: hypothetical protein ACJATA_000892 [Sphingobacteriales bacterium]
MRNKLVLFFALILVTSYTIKAQETRFGNYQLKKLLVERKELIGDYGDSMEKGTGIFGLQTKRDLKRANEILLGIIRKDNEIMKQLESEADGGKIDVEIIDSKKSELEEKNKTNLKIINILNTKVDEMKLESEANRGDLNTYKMLTVFLSVLLMVITIRLIRIKNK